MTVLASGQTINLCVLRRERASLGDAIAHLIQAFEVRYDVYVSEIILTHDDYGPLADKCTGVSVKVEV